MKTIITKLIILMVMSLGLPLFGVILTNKPIDRYLEFPPRTLYVQHKPFSWVAFLCYSLFILVVIVPYVIHGMKGRDEEKAGSSSLYPFPWWGWVGILCGIMGWIVAWSRYDWFSSFQAHTFTPLWIAYIITTNALTFSRTGHCMLVDRTRFFMLLFPVSAAFWWCFEYLNRFVQNWHYTGANFGPWEYFLYATLPFSTVLPAVLGTREWLLCLSWPAKKFQNFIPIRVSHPKVVALVIFLATGIGLACFGVWPNYLFPLLWISPLMIIVSLTALFGEPHIFSDITRGDWHIIVSSAVAALICGFFWEMWNYHSLAKWRYTVPFVQRFQVFEMPILGYAGYLPFGLECALISDMLLKREEKPYRFQTL
jgi:hypothetical protein